MGRCVLPSWLRSGYLWRVEWCLCQGLQPNCGCNWKGVISNASAEQVSPCLDNAISQRHCKYLWLWWITLDPSCQQEVKGTTSHCQYSAHWLASSSRACCPSWCTAAAWTGTWSESNPSCPSTTNTSASTGGSASDTRQWAASDVWSAVRTPDTSANAKAKEDATRSPTCSYIWGCCSRHTEPSCHWHSCRPWNTTCVSSCHACSSCQYSSQCWATCKCSRQHCSSCQWCRCQWSRCRCQWSRRRCQWSSRCRCHWSECRCQWFGSCCFNSCPRGHWGFKCCRATSSQCSSARWESRSGKWTSSFVCHLPIVHGQLPRWPSTWSTSLWTLFPLRLLERVASSGTDWGSSQVPIASPVQDWAGPTCSCRWLAAWFRFRLMKKMFQLLWQLFPPWALSFCESSLICERALANLII